MITDKKQDQHFFLLLNSTGTPGGGAAPIAGATLTPQTLTTALALVPVGLIPIAVFPPYNTPRTVPAIRLA